MPSLTRAMGTGAMSEDTVIERAGRGGPLTVY